MAVLFQTLGPIEIPVDRLPGGRAVTARNISEFWASIPELTDCYGCYIFGMRVGGGITLGYVGKATRTFRQECFTPDKIGKYSLFMARYAKGTPIMYFIVAPAGRGRPNLSALADCEKELIDLAYRANADLINVQGTGGPSFAIPHITEDARGRPSTATLSLMRALYLDEPRERIRGAHSEGKAKENDAASLALTESPQQARMDGIELVIHEPIFGPALSSSGAAK